MKLPTQNLLAWEVCVTLFHLLVLGLTFLRLIHRWQTRQMWWDDYGALVCLVVDVLFVILMWLRFRGGAAGITEPKFEGFVYSAWFNSVFSWAVIWGSRFSLSLSIARIFPEKSICRKFSFGLSIAFFLSYVAVILGTALACKSTEGAWYDLNFKRKSCLKQPGGRVVAWLSTVALDFSADILLVVTPLVMLWKVKLPKKERRLILALFASSVVSLLSSITFMVIWFFTVDQGVDSLILVSMFGLLQAAILLLTCNLLVVTMLVYRFILRKSEDNDHASRPSSPPVTTHHQLTSNNSNADEKLNVDSLSLTTIYDTFSRVSSAPPTTTSSFQDPAPLSASYIIREGETGSSSQMTGSSWNFSSKSSGAS